MANQQINVYLRLLNGRRFNSQMNQAAASVRGSKAAMESAASAGTGLAKAGYAVEAGMYAAGAATRLLTYGAGVLAGAWTAMGIEFNATMEGNTLALTHFAGSQQAAADMTKELFDIAKNTPFSFTDITTAARRFLAFGFTVSETNDLLKVLGDTISYTGGGTDEILRMAKAFGDIRAKGRLMQQEMNQLANLGINPLETLRAGGLDLTEKQMKNVGRAGIDAEEAISAFQRGLEDIYGGGAQEYLKTFTGQWQRLQDNIRQTAGTSTKGVFGWLKEGLKFVNDMLEGQGGKLGSTIRGVLEGGLKLAGAAFLFLRERALELWDALKPAQPFLANVLWPILKGIAVGIISTVVVAWKLLIGAIKILAPILGWIGEKLKPLKPLFEIIGMAIAFVFGGAIIKAAGWLVKFGGMFGTIGRFMLVVMSPIRLIVGAIGLLIKAFSAIRTAGFTAIKLGFWKIVAFLVKLPVKFLGLGKKMALGLVQGIISIFAAAGGLAGDIGRAIGDWLNKETLFGNTVNLGVAKVKIPALATGGTITGGGYALVGEEGPELVSFPTGTTVAPMRPAAARVNPRGGGSGGSGSGPVATRDSRPVVTKVFLDRRQIAEAMGEFVEDREARG